MREFLSLLDGAMPYVVLLPTGQLNPDIPDECRALIEYVRLLVVARWKEPLPAATYEKEYVGIFIDELVDDSFRDVRCPPAVVVGEEGLFPGEEE